MGNDMQYYRELYISETIEEKKEEVMQKLAHGRMLWHLYLIVLSDSPNNHLEFFDAMMLRQQYFCPQKEHLKVIGLADSYEDAVRLVGKIAEDVVRETGGTDFRGYFESRMEKEAGSAK